MNPRLAAVRVRLALHLLRVAAAMLPVGHPAGVLARRAAAIGAATAHPEPEPPPASMREPRR